jgi:cathepsin B
MKLSAVAVIATAASAHGQHATGATQINDEKHIGRLNSVAGAGWVAGPSVFFEGVTFDQARSLLGTALSHISEHMDSVRNQSVYDVMDAPDSFDARTQWKGLIHPIRNQEQCGSCWAFSATEVLSDRVAIATGKASPVLSVEDMVSCDSGDNGCGGGRLPSAWQYLQNTGIVTDSCFPYSAGGGQAPACVTQCVDSETFVKTKARNSYAISTVPNMMKEISTHGPIQVAFMVYKSFMNYRRGIYSKHIWETLPEGGHAVKMVGYGSESGTDYWIVANSWGPTWGEEGFFRIKKGGNACGIENMGPPYAGLPSVDGKDIVV